MIHSLSYLAVGLIALYVGLLLMVWHFQERILFQPPAAPLTSPAPGKQVHYRAADAVELFGYLVGEWRPGGTVVVAFHGNAEVARWLIPWAAMLASQTRSCVLLPEYRGYDGLSGAPSYAASAHDALAALNYARDTLRAAPSDVVLFGHSLGSAIAAELAASTRPRALVLQAPFTSARAMAGRLILPGLRSFFRFISRVHFNTVARVASLALPVSVVHGDRDSVVPVKMGREVFAAAANPGELLTVRGAGHNDIAEVGGAAYWAWIARAVRGAPERSATPSAATRMRSAP